MKIYTKTGDQGDTGLFGGGRVPKDHPRVSAYGEVDELNSFLGLARATQPVPRIDDLLLTIQRDLLALGALLATPNPEKMREHLVKARVDEARITELEQAIDAADRDLTPLKAFIIPGGSSKAATLHVCRTVCRRAERAVVAMRASESIPEIAVIYLNRLSDLLFTLARLAQKIDGGAEESW
ncbi:MAG TPA: cob(I)yrinic acid a,c-diamide adenosyltransferase [Gemmatimonadaceae bacterium]|nr:cob(I)yrinic acid a,c-diamide adenosyltransferase [Gemmatimonadaceae bacterium]